MDNSDDLDDVNIVIPSEYIEMLSAAHKKKIIL